MELYIPGTETSCSVEDLQLDKVFHSSCGGFLCGHYYNQDWAENSNLKCERIIGTEVSPLPSLTLTEKRSQHLCWRLPGEEGILLLGGSVSKTTTEVITPTSSSASFDLAYPTL